MFFLIFFLFFIDEIDQRIFLFTPLVVRLLLFFFFLICFLVCLYDFWYFLFVVDESDQEISLLIPLFLHLLLFFICFLCFLLCFLIFFLFVVHESDQELCLFHCLFSSWFLCSWKCRTKSFINIQTANCERPIQTMYVTVMQSSAAQQNDWKLALLYTNDKWKCTNQSPHTLESWKY